MSDKSYGFSDLECQIILAQIERRAKLRKEFLRLRSDPCQHSLEAGYVVRNIWFNRLRYQLPITRDVHLFAYLVV